MMKKLIITILIFLYISSSFGVVNVYHYCSMGINPEPVLNEPDCCCNDTVSEPETELNQEPACCSVKDKQNNSHTPHQTSSKDNLESHISSNCCTFEIHVEQSDNYTYQPTETIYNFTVINKIITVLPAFKYQSDNIFNKPAHTHSSRNLPLLI